MGAKKTYKQELVTVIGTNYIDLIVPDFLEKCFEVYKKKEFNERQFQVSIYENTYATAGIVLIALAFEAYRNRIFYLEKKTVGKIPAIDLAKVFKLKVANFPQKDFENLLNEVFILRDVIVHNHIYKVKVEFDSEWKMLWHTQKKLEGYGDDKKFKQLVNTRTKKTLNLGLNVQPGKIGFEELFLVLVIFDCFVGISEKILGRPYVPFHFWKKIDGIGTEHLYQYLTHFYNLIPNKKFLNSTKPLFIEIRKKYEKYLPEYSDYFINNICLKCGEFGFKQIKDVYACKKCGYKIEIISTKHKFEIIT